MRLAGTVAGRRPGLTAAGAMVLLLVTGGAPAVGQTDPSDHSAHHPAPGAAPTEQTAPMGNTASQQGGACGGMMGCMGGVPRQFYPSLMEMPALTPEARRLIEREAGRRIGVGAEAVTDAQMRIHHAMAANDPVAVQQAAAAAREGLLQLESGAAALRAVNEGQAPRRIALDWFRGQLGLPEAKAASMAPTEGWGLSWYHLTTMAFLVAFLLGTLALQYARMRRVGGLVQRLASGSPGGAPGPAPAARGPAPSGPPPSPPVAGPVRQPAPAEPEAAAPAATPTAPPAPAPAVATAAARRPWSGTLRVAAIFPETPSVKTFRLVDPDGGDIPFTFMPGQFLTFSAEIDGERARRSYTIASSPLRRGYVEVTVKREEKGLISRHLHDRVAVGSLLEVSAPSGVFTFTGTEANSIVLIAGGVGITPMMSITRYLTDRAFPGEIHLLYGVRTPQELIFREELEYLQKRHPNLHVAATVSRAEGAAWMGGTGPVSKDFIVRAVPDIARRRVHLCGPPPMMEAVKAALAELSVPREQVRTEAFGPARGVTPGTPAPLPAPAAPALGEPAAAPVPRIATAEVRFTRSGKTAPLSPEQSVLEAAEAVGVPIDYSCRVGICGTCKVRLLEGSVTMEVEEGLLPDEKARGIILACQAKSIGNLAVEA